MPGNQKKEDVETDTNHDKTVDDDNKEHTNEQMGPMLGRLLGKPGCHAVMILARAVGIAVCCRSGSWLAITLVDCYFHNSSPSQPFLIEQLLGSKYLFSWSWQDCPKTWQTQSAILGPPGALFKFFRFS